MTEKPRNTINLRKNMRETIRISRSMFRGHDLTQLWVWFDTGDGISKPSSKGISFQSSSIDEIIKALQEVSQSTAEESGK